MNRSTVSGLAASLIILGLALSAAATPSAPYDLKLESGRLADVLRRFADQVNLQLAFYVEDTHELKAGPLYGRYTPEQALDLLLKGSDLEYQYVDARTISVRKRSSASGNLPAAEATPAAITRMTQTADSAQNKRFAQNKPEETTDSVNEVGIPEILVKGSRILNMDIPRTRDDVLPYIVFDRKRIEQSGAVNLQDFFKQRLPMNTAKVTPGNVFNDGFQGRSGTRSQIDLRGLGTNQTLILIDGRRTSNASFEGLLMQQDVNGIPLSAVERIEVLPTSASGIYGGEATGGVINIILRRDYQGTELKLGYDNTFDTDDGIRTVELNTGFNLEGGKTNVMIAASFKDSNAMLGGDRSFMQEYRDRVFANRPALWLPSSTTRPPIGYTPNICSGSSIFCGGPPLVLKSGNRPLGSNFTFVPVGYAGVASDNGQGLIDNAGRYNFELPDTPQQPEGRRSAMHSTPRLGTLNATMRREFGARVQAYLEVSLSNSTAHSPSSLFTAPINLPASSPNNPFQQAITMTVPIPHEIYVDPFSMERRLVGGVIAKFSRGWQAEMDFVWAKGSIGTTRTNASSTALLALLPGLDPVRDTNVYAPDISALLVNERFGPFETIAKTTSLIVSGPVGTLPWGGKPKLSMRLEHRDEVFGGGVIAAQVAPDRFQSVDSAYAEVAVPLVSAQNRVPFVQELELQVSGRRDDYRVTGTTALIDASNPLVSIDNKLHSTNPLTGLRWKPIEDVALRVSYGTAFLPPNVTQLVPRLVFPGTNHTSITDPRRGGELVVSPFPNLSRGNPDLRPEESESWSGGIILTPRWVPGLRLSIDYMKVKKIDGIVASYPGSFQGIINDEALLPNRVKRNTDPATFGIYGVGPITLIDGTLFNVSSVKLEAYDVQIDYSLPTARWGSFDFFIMGTWQPHYQTAALEGLPTIENVGFNILEYKANGGVTWNRGNLTLGWLTNYFHSYYPYGAVALPLTAANITARANAVQAQGSSKVSQQFYHDVFARYRFGRDSDSGSSRTGLGSRLLQGIELSGGVRNILNTLPAFDSSAGFGFNYSGYADPRVASYYLSIKRAF